MTATAQRTPRAKQPRTCRFSHTETPGEYTVTITQGKESKSYLFCEFDTELGGRAFHWLSLADGEHYDVFLSDDEDAEPSSCCCKGHLRYGHKTICRHLACSRVLIETGKI